MRTFHDGPLSENYFEAAELWEDKAEKIASWEFSWQGIFPRRSQFVQVVC